MEAVWTAGDILGFCGTILSFLGTFILGRITVRLSEENNGLNQRLLEVEKKRDNLEKDERLGIVWAENLIIETEKENNDITCIIMRIPMKCSGIGVITKMTCSSAKICHKGFRDLSNNRSELAWNIFYCRSDQKKRYVDPKEKCFEEIMILSKSDKNPEAFETMVKIINANGFFAVILTYDYKNTLSETRSETLKIEYGGNRIIGNELISIDGISVGEN